MINNHLALLEQIKSTGKCPKCNSHIPVGIFRHQVKTKSHYMLVHTHFWDCLFCDLIYEYKSEIFKIRSRKDKNNED